MLLQVKDTKSQITSPPEAARIFRAILASENEIDRDKEHFWTLGLSAVKRVKYLELVSLGTLTESLVLPRETFRLAIMKAVAGIIICHNHPSGEVLPSRMDRAITKRLIQVGNLLVIPGWDHIILGKPEEDTYYSFLESDPDWDKWQLEH